jgi:hypothetical protein
MIIASKDWLRLTKQQRYLLLVGLVTVQKKSGMAKK